MLADTCDSAASASMSVLQPEPLFRSRIVRNKSVTVSDAKLNVTNLGELSKVLASVSFTQ